MDQIFLLGYHILIATGIALVAVGASDAADAKNATEFNSAESKSKVGAVLLFLGWIILLLKAIMSAMPGHLSMRQQSQHDDGTRLLIAVLLAQPFMAVRVIATIVYFATGNQSINGATGTLGVKIGLYFLMELAVMLLLVGTGVATRNVKNHQAKEMRGTDLALAGR